MRFREIVEAVVDTQAAIKYTVPIEAKKAVAILETHCSDALNAYVNQLKTGSRQDPVLMYKGMTGMSNPVIATNPGKILRKSQNTANIYTEYLSEYSQAWKQLPPRNRCIVCSSSSYYAAGYGTLYVVFPENGSKIGVCPEQDFWNSFRKSNIDDMGDFAQMLQAALERAGVTLDFALKEPIKNFTSRNYYNDELQPLNAFRGFSGVEPNTKLGDALEYKLDPNANGFRIMTTGQFNQMPSDRETWTSGKCVLVRSSYFQDEIMPLLKKDNNNAI